MDLALSLVNRLNSDTAVTSKISSYNGSPSVFASWPVPPDASRPFIVIQLVSYNAWDDAVVHGRDTLYDVGCYCNSASGSDIHDLVESVRARIHKQQLSLDTGRFVKVVCTDVAPAPTDSSLIGMVLTFRILSMEA